MKLVKNGKQTHPLALHSRRCSSYRHITLDGYNCFSGEGGTNLPIGVPRKECPEIFIAEAVFLKMQNQTLNRSRHVGRRAAIAYRPRDRGDVSNTSAHAEIISVHHFSVGFDFLAFD